MAAENSLSRGKLLVQLALNSNSKCTSESTANCTETVAETSHFRIQGNTITEIALPDISCHESDDCLEEHDDSDIDPDWTPEKRKQGDFDVVTDDSSDDLPTQQDNSETTDKIRAKRGRSDEKQWESNQNKKLRMHGLQYKGVKKDANGHYKYCKERNARIMGPRGCSKRCEKANKGRSCTIITETERTDIFNSFWENMNWKEKKVYVSGMVNKLPVSERQDPGKESRRQITYKYHLKQNTEIIPVCKNMFLSTPIYGWIRASTNGIPKSPTPSKRGSMSEKQSSCYACAKNFLDSLSKLPSHYCRATTSKMYLEPLFTSYAELYRVYKEKCADDAQDTICMKLFKRLFDDMNLSLYQPKKDQCDICCSYESNNISDEEYNEHIVRKDAARNEKCLDKEAATHNESLKVITVDLQAVLLSPLLKASSMYYKTKLSCHNFTIYDLITKDVVCYFWHEGDAELTANSFASCLTDYIENISGSVKEVIIFSDGCPYQNRNVTLSNALSRLARLRDITIVQKFLEKGHTHMECDNVHSAIERKLRKKPIYCPQNYVDIMQSARLSQPYKVKYLSHEFFKDYSALRYYTSIRPGVRSGDPVVVNIRVLKYSSDGDIQYKLSVSDDYQDLPRRSKDQHPSDDHQVESLYDAKLAIKGSKYAHLQELKKVIPKDYHPFYDSLPHD